MSPARVARGALLFAWLLACGERAGDPVVRVDLTDAGGSAGSGGAGSGGAGSGGAGGSLSIGAAGGGGAAGELEPGPTGLCGACESSDQCGDGNDVCVRHQGVSRCGRDCDEAFGCPDGYSCVELDNSLLLQCVADATCLDPVTPPPALADVRAYLLSRINTERIERNLPALAVMACLDRLAQESALDYSRTEEPLGKFIDECDPIWPNCECNWSAQAEIAVAHYGLDWLAAIERALSDDRFARSFIEFEVTHVGIGFWISGDEAWIALSFS